MAQISLPNQLTNGTVADASQVMANFHAIVDVVNGNLGSDNLKNLTGSDITVQDLNGGTGILNDFTARFQAGEVVIENVPPKEMYDRKVMFPKSFPGAPIVIVQIRTKTPISRYASYSDAQKDSFMVDVYHSGDIPQNIYVAWVAIYLGAM